MLLLSLQTSPPLTITPYIGVVERPDYHASTPYPSGLGHETMPYFDNALKPHHAKEAQVQKL
jgi:hypothetical protein